MPFELASETYRSKGDLNPEFSITVQTVLSEEHADHFIELQTLAVNEISQEINQLTKEGLMKISPCRAKDFLVALIYNNGQIAGYGCSYEDEETNTIYLDTIYVKQQHRKKGLSNLVIRSLIEMSMAQNKNIQKFRAVTQPGNHAAIKLLQKIDFKFVTRR